VLRLAPLLLLSLLASAASAETLWLRGRGKDVWIEKDGRYQPPKEDRKGLTLLSAPIRAAEPREPEPRRPRWESRRDPAVVVLGAPYVGPRSYFHRAPAYRWHRPYADGPRYDRGHRRGYGGHRHGYGRRVQPVGPHGGFRGHGGGSGRR